MLVAKWWPIEPMPDSATQNHENWGHYNRWVSRSSQRRICRVWTQCGWLEQCWGPAQTVL